MKKTILIFLSIVTLISCSKDDNEYLKEKLFGQADLTTPIQAGIDLNFSSKEIDFGTVLNGTINKQVITITNASPYPTNVSVRLSQTTSTITFKENNFKIDANGTYQFEVTFFSSKTTKLDDSVILVYNAGNNSSGIKLTGNSVANLPTSLIAAPSGIIDFGTVLVGQASTKNITLTNTGTADAIWTPVGTELSFSPFGGSIGIGKSQEVVMTLSRSQLGVHNSTQTFSFNGGTVVISYKVNVVTTLPTVLTVTPSTIIDFGTVVVGQTATKNITLTNTGPATTTWTPIGTILTFNPLSGSINAGANQIISMAIKATGTGVYNNTQTFSYNGGTVQVPYTVNRIAATRIISVSCTTSTAFGDVPVNTTISKIIRIANTGNAPLSVTSIVAQSTPLNQITCNYSGIIQPGMYAETYIYFKPTSTGSKSLSIIVQSDKTSGINSLSFSGFGK